MLHGLLFILLFALAALLVVAMLIVRFLSNGFRIIRDAAKAATGGDAGNTAGTGTGRNDNRRRQERPEGRRHTTASGETIIDSRDPQNADRRIFADNEGEYVDFEEER